MIVKRFISSRQYQTNTYVARCSKTIKGLVIDPGYERQEVLKYIENEGIDVKYVVNTHAHPDHCAGNAEVCQKLNAPLFIGKKEEKILRGLMNMKMIPESPRPDNYLSEGDTFSVGKLTFTVLETPGHTNGSISIMNEEGIFTGDLLIHSGGQYSPAIFGGSNEKINQTIVTKIIPLNKGLTVYPGHGPSTTLEEMIKGLRNERPT